MALWEIRICRLNLHHPGSICQASMVMSLMTVCFSFRSGKITCVNFDNLVGFVLLKLLVHELLRLIGLSVSLPPPLPFSPSLPHSHTNIYST